MTGPWTDPIGAPLDRVDAREKVTGRARYSGDVHPARAAYAVMVTSAIAAGQLRSIDSTAALTSAGVLQVWTHQNLPAWPRVDGQVNYTDRRLPLSDNRIVHGGQCVALVVANTLEQAEEAAQLVVPDYQPVTPVTTLRAALLSAYQPTGGWYDPEVVRGDPDGAFRSARFRIDQEYATPALSHSPMEPSATVAEWDGDRLTVHDSSQNVYGHRALLARLLGMPVENVRLVCSYLGGAFGSKTALWGHSLLAAVAARELRRPVRLTLSRKQMFLLTGNMPATVQRMQLAAGTDGRLSALVQHAVNTTSFITDRLEPTIRSAPALYAVPNLRATGLIAKVNVGTSTFMRTPGDTPGQFAVESALDELAWAIGIDPVELRRRNFSDQHAQRRLPWTGNQLLRCYDIGEREFGWRDRISRPDSMRDGDDHVGYGMAAGYHEESQTSATAQIDLAADGTAVIRTSTQELGGGGLTVLVQIAASRLGLPPHRVRIESGDTNLPQAAPTFSAQTSGNTGSAVLLAADQVRASVTRIAVADPASPLSGLAVEDVVAADGRLSSRTDPSRGESYQQLLGRHGNATLREQGVYQPPPEDAPARAVSSCFAAHFVEVRVNRVLRRVRVARHVGVFDAGRILNIKTATNQARGGMIFASGGALMERFDPDPATGLALSPALTDYHVPVHADVGDVRPYFVDEADLGAHPNGAKGLGEICTIGVNAAIANAVYHATGRRVRELPITPERLLHL